MKLLMDTSAIISYVNGDGRVLQEMEKAESVCTSSLCAYETLVGSQDEVKVERLVAALTPLPFTFRDSQARGSDLREDLEIGPQGKRDGCPHMLPGGGTRASGIDWG